MTIDRITLSVIRNGLAHAADEMSEALKYSSYSPIIREMLDYSCAIFDASGNLIAQAANIPAQLGSMGYALAALLERWPAQAITPGDVFICNDPYSGGTHTPDIHIFVPVFYDGELLAHCGSIAHHADVGGAHPGTEGFANRSIFEEGLRILPLKLYEQERPNEGVFDLIRANVREPAATLGDLRAQIASCKTGCRRVTAIASRYGGTAVRTAIADSIDYSERRVSKSLLQMPDGVAEAVGFLDDDGVSDTPVRIHVRVEKRESHLTVDLTGTDPATQGGMNVPRAAAISAALYVLRCLIDDDIPQNEGCFRPLTVILPPGSLVDPPFPSAVSLRHLAVQRIADTILAAIAELAPSHASAGTFVGFSSLAAEVISPRTGQISVIQDDLGGGTGATWKSDGLDGVDTHLGNVGILPAEVCELQYPIRVLATEYIPDSAGAGRFRGGLGIRRHYQFLGPSREVVIYTEQTNPHHAPRGIKGGQPGAPAHVEIIRADGSSQLIRKATVTASSGDALVVRTGGGGGFGDPAERDLTLVERDVQEDKVSSQAARDLYRVQFECDDRTIDRTATTRLRENASQEMPVGSAPGTSGEHERQP